MVWGWTGRRATQLRRTSRSIIRGSRTTSCPSTVGPFRQKPPTKTRACFRARNDWARRVRYPVAWVTDLSNITKAPATQRKALAEHLKQFEAFSERWNAGSALIVPSAWLRGLVTAVFWVSPPKYPHKTFSELLPGQRWAQEQLAARLAQRD